MRRTIVITGASDGIGAAAAEGLHQQDVQLVLVGRSPGKTSALAERLGADHFVADFSSLDQVAQLARQLLDTYERIDVLANNAGQIGAKRELTPDGHESVFQINHLAPFLLTSRLLEKLAQSQGRVIFTTSVAGTSARARAGVDDLESDRRWGALEVYATTKLQNMMTMSELHRRWHPRGVSTAAFHPGLVRSQFGRSSSRAVRWVLNSPLRYAMRSPAAGADTLLWLATSEPGSDWQSGSYYSNRKPAELNPAAADQAQCAALWDASTHLLATWL